MPACLPVIIWVKATQARRHKSANMFVFYWVHEQAPRWLLAGAVKQQLMTSVKAQQQQQQQSCSEE